MELDLILDTSRKGIALGIYDAGKPVCEHFEPETRGENLGHTLDAVLDQAKVSLDDIKRVMVTLGGALLFGKAFLVRYFDAQGFAVSFRRRKCGGRAVRSHGILLRGDAERGTLYSGGRSGSKV